MITRRDVVIAVVAACATLAAVALAQSSGKTVMKSTVFDWNGVKAEPTKVGARRQFFEAPTATLDQLSCHVTTLNPGEMPHAGHQHPAEELIIVKEGMIEAVQNSVTNRVGPGSIVFEASNEYHSLRNVGQTQASYYVIKWFSPGMLKDKK
ncbi:MAG TPA: cupin domain-containing protein [Verrucomicrobiae bacterium]|nr:cupin domain-containing protein [Verrucomicrobiae bacterium]